MPPPSRGSGLFDSLKIHAQLRQDYLQVAMNPSPLTLILSGKTGDADIAAKRVREIAVNLFTREKVTGDLHAPLLYTQDPRVDAPAELQAHIQPVIAGCDATLVFGWLGTQL
ncbi:MAG: hypothetical protein KDE54_15985 [Caldilineaceae bacterium]|nr:hypothetical protein [Caldilineaceae bacterium]MCB0098361.1 hypothetical protein [Caldilineaceae bacterium]MCB0140164.1 hypothetical protein [Caldilineaceae bacterium]